MAGTGARIAAVVAVAALAVGVGVLSTLALQSVGGAGTPQTAPPAPTFTFGDLGTLAPAESPSATPTLEPQSDAPQERFAAVLAEQVWRGTAGSCDANGDADGIDSAVAPLVQYSTDGGETWVDVTPPGALQVLAVAAFGDGQGEVIAATGAGCAPAALRTYTAGRAWESYPNVLATSTFVSPTDRSSVVTAGNVVAAPCADARSVRSSRGEVGLVCNGAAFVLAGGAWTEVTASALTLDAVSGTIIVAHAAESCAGGVAVTRFTGTSGSPLGCISAVDAAAPAALSVLASDFVFWTGDSIRALD